MFPQLPTSQVLLPQDPTIREAVKKYNEACFPGGRMVRKGFDIVEFDAVAEGTEAVVEAIGVLIEVPKLISSYRTIRFNTLKV
jgi:hypothetical protein